MEEASEALIWIQLFLHEKNLMIKAVNTAFFVAVCKKTYRFNPSTLANITY